MKLKQMKKRGFSLNNILTVGRSYSQSTSEEFLGSVKFSGSTKEYKRMHSYLSLHHPHT